MVHHEVDDDVDAPLVGRLQEGLEVLHGAVLGVDGHVVRYVVLVIAGRGGNGHKPNSGIAHITDIVQLLGNAVKVADAVTVRIAERVYENFVVVSYASSMIFSLSVGALLHADAVIASVTPAAAAAIALLTFHKLPLYGSARYAFDVVALQPYEQCGYGN